MSVAAQVYAEQLISKGHGFPLWYPDIGEVHLGDVGYIWDGSFTRLFNVTLPPEHPINQRGVPEGFMQLQYDPKSTIRKVERYLEKGSVCSQSVKRLQIGIQGGTR
jgi:hypothetical protein